MFREHAANDIFVDQAAEGMSDLLGDAYTAEPRVAMLSSLIVAMSSDEGPLGPGLRWR